MYSSKFFQCSTFEIYAALDILNCKIDVDGRLQILKV